MNIILCGYKGCGKTTVGKAYSEKHQYDFIDIDDLIITESASGKTIGVLHREIGDTAFRELERKIIMSIANRSSAVIATGGGSLLNAESVTHLKTLGPIIYLQLDSQYLYQRMIAISTLPSFIRPDSIKQDFDDCITSRKSLYSSAADHVINTNHMSVDETVNQINEYRYHYGK